MFLLNVVHIPSVFTYPAFTIQNVSIKWKRIIQHEDFIAYLQYKMFLLNNDSKVVD